MNDKLKFDASDSHWQVKFDIRRLTVDSTVKWNRHIANQMRTENCFFYQTTHCTDNNANATRVITAITSDNGRKTGFHGRLNKTGTNGAAAAR